MRKSALLPCLLTCLLPAGWAPEARADEADPAAWRAQRPAPLAPRAFTLPEAAEGRLSNGVRVLVVENHETPMVYIRLAVATGSLSDPPELPGLASAAMDMLNEGAAGKDAAALSVAQRRLGATVSSGGGLDTVSVGLSTPRRSLGPAIDLLADVALRPDFPAAAWQIVQTRRVQALEAAKDDPEAIAGRIWARHAWGDAYAGRRPTVESTRALSPERLRAWHAAELRPERALLLVGGDVRLDEVLPELERAFGGWAGQGAVPAHPSPPPLPRPGQTQVLLHHRDGAPQSVVRVGGPVGARTDADRPAFLLANRMWGEQFTARLNMNLREEKGWTYGARSGVTDTLLPGVWSAGASVRADASDDAVLEILRELRESLGPRPFTEDELRYARTGLLGSWPLAFERPGHLLGEQAEVWRYQLPADWISGTPARVSAVSLADAQAAWARQLRPDSLLIVIVGDADEVEPGLRAAGLPVIRVDADGNPSP